MGRFQDFEVHLNSRAKPVPWGGPHWWVRLGKQPIQTNCF